MNYIYNLIISNIYLYVCVIIGLIILTAILVIVLQNQKNRRQIKRDFIEAERTDAEMKAMEVENKKSELEDLLKRMQEDIATKPEDVVRKFEEEQEQKAIISYQELVDSVKSGKIEVIDDEESDTNFVESLNMEIEEEPIVNYDGSEDAVTGDMLKEAIENISTNSLKEPPKKFQQSKFISPVYGVLANDIEYPTIKKTDNMVDLINTRDYNELTEEIKRQEEFLQALIEFRNNL